MSAHARKAALRKTLKAKRQAMAPAEVEEKSAAIVQHLTSTDLWQQAATICAYVSCGNEVATHACIHEAITAGKTILVPKVAGDALHWYQLESWDALALGAFGILEPVPSSCRAVADPQPDLVLIPGVAFDRSGQRLGQGAGHYDRFLQNRRVKKVGLAYDWQILDALPCEPHDIPLDNVISESGVHACPAS